MPLPQRSAWGPKPTKIGQALHRSGVLRCYLYSDRAVWRFGHRAADFFPKELVVAIAGIALLSTIGGLASALRDERHREPALITFLVTLSGITLMDIGSAFWGVVAGSRRFYLCNSTSNHVPPCLVNDLASSWMLRGCMRPFSKHHTILCSSAHSPYTHHANSVHCRSS